MGDLFNPAVLAVRAQQMVLATESAALASRWFVDDPGSESLWVAASSLRSAFYLWLEDDDRALSGVRSGLEAIARARAWRTKPDQARKARTRSISRDWFQVAGWRRLQLLNRSLGELAHAHPESRWTGARTALVNALPPDEEGDPDKVARGGTLRAALSLLGVEAGVDQEGVSASGRGNPRDPRGGPGCGRS